MDNDLEIIRKRVEDFRQERGYLLAPEAERILQDIVRMKDTVGDFYCPCRQVQTADTVCVCKPVRNGLVDATGTCFCNLFLAGES